MPQSTLDTLTDRVQTLASRTGDQAGKTMTALLPVRSRRPALSTRFLQIRAWTQGFVAGARLRGRTPSTTRLAWRTGKLVGRTQGTVALGPHAARGWWVGTKGRLQGTTAGQLLQWTPMVIALGRPVARLWSPSGRAKTPATTAGWAAWSSRLPFVAGRATDQASTRVSRAQARAQAAAALVAMKSAQTARQGRRAFQRARWFVLGLAVGAVWAFLFTPRPGPGYQAVQQSGQRASTA